MKNGCTVGLFLRPTLNGLREHCTLQDFAPPAQPFGVSPLPPASQSGFLHLPSGWLGEVHPSPIRMWIFALKGYAKHVCTLRCKQLRDAARRLWKKVR